MLPGFNPQPVYGPLVDRADGFVHIPTPNLSPCVTDTPGVFVTGTAAGPMDIVDSIVMAGAAAAETAAYLENQPRRISANGHRAMVPEKEGLVYA
jgi:heterodisulfide reductase subunit A-like polyferredoxin